MKKYFVLFLTLVFSISLFGCFSNTNIQDLENRISYLEQQLGISNTNTNVIVGKDLREYITNYDDVVNTINNILNIDNAKISQNPNRKSDINELESFGNGDYNALVNNINFSIHCEEHIAIRIVYSNGNTIKGVEIKTTDLNNKIDSVDDSKQSTCYDISSMSVDEIIDECKYYFNNIPKKGETYDEYKNKLHATPVDNPTNSTSYRFSKNTSDHIESIYISTRTEMDGTIGYSDNYCSIKITLVLNNYDRAEELYDKLIDFLSSSCFNNTNHNDKDGTSWSTSFSVKVNDYITQHPSLTMEYSNDKYIISIPYYHFFN